MNWIIRAGQWWEKYRPVRRGMYDRDVIHFFDQIADKATISDMAGVFTRLDVIENKMDVIESDLKSPPAAKELALLKMRLDRMELYVGLKRDPVGVNLKNAPKIS